MTPCDQCTRGWVPDGDWYQACPFCKGRGVLTAPQLEKLFELDGETLKRVLDLSRKNRPATLKKVLERFSILTARAKPLEMQT